MMSMHVAESSRQFIEVCFGTDGDVVVITYQRIRSEVWNYSMSVISETNVC